MSCTQFVSVHADARSRIFKHREELQAKHSVVFNPYPKDRETGVFSGNTRRGAYTDMKIVGTAGAVSAARREIDRILNEWQTGYDEFCARRSAANKAKRSRSAQNTTGDVSWPTIQDNSTLSSPVVQSTNPFASLIGLETEVVHEELPKTIVKTKTLTGWSTIVSKNTDNLSNWGDDAWND
tara:strand:- start:86 stop:628 length:543 start_codon:yes stop_codon:yes gene_type:complete